MSTILSLTAIHLSLVFKVCWTLMRIYKTLLHIISHTPCHIKNKAKNISIPEPTSRENSSCKPNLLLNSMTLSVS